MIREQVAEFWDHYALRGVEGFALYVKVKGKAKHRRLSFQQQTLKSRSGT